MKKLTLVLVIATLLVSAAGTNASLVAWYKMNDAVGSNFFADSSGNGYNGTISGAATSGLTGSSFNFSGDGVVVAAPATVPASTKNDFTWSVQVKTSTAKAAFIQRSLNPTDWVAGDSTLAIDTSRPKFAAKTLYPAWATSAINDNAWHTITATCDFGETVRIYIDGVLSVTQWVQGLKTVNDTGFKFYFGKGAYGTYTGEMKDIRIYDTCLTDAQVAAIPEPATMSLVGLGMLLFARKRK